MRSNERFSGRNHARHLCKECARLGKEELAYRQAIRNLEQLLTADGGIPRKHQNEFNKYLTHESERVRNYAIEIEAAHAIECADWRLLRDLDELNYQLAAEAGLFDYEEEVSLPHPDRSDEEIPF